MSYLLLFKELIGERTSLCHISVFGEVDETAVICWGLLLIKKELRLGEKS